MKVLHIGRKENMERNTVKTDFTASVQVVSLPMGLSADEYLEACPDAEVIVADAIAPVPGELIRGLSQLQMIHSEGVAYNRIDIGTARDCGVYVCNCAGMNASAVAEQTVLLMMGLLKNVIAGDKAVRAGQQIQMKEGYMTRGDLKELRDCRVGLVGFGDIGKCTARLLAAYGAQTFYYKRTPLGEEEEREYGAACLAMDELLATCDIVSLHLPVTPQTEQMCDAAFFAKMKPGAYFVNTSRGELVDDEALIGALRSGHVAMAGLDTLDHEPVAQDHVLVQQPQEIADKILFSPHIGGITAPSFRRGYAMIWENIERIARGECPKNVR
ncbi:MAG: NAD(P)-binding domain-containing protein [Lachnospiraceae bacterium]|nr:NAD(P)-binding domain-containing protein [Lachnospiraceae bacterium]